jgi:hypothetical protein
MLIDISIAWANRAAAPALGKELGFETKVGSFLGKFPLSLLGNRENPDSALKSFGTALSIKLQFDVLEMLTWHKHLA